MVSYQDRTRLSTPGLGGLPVAYRGPVDEPELDLDDAYAVETPDDNRDLYRRWASTYERSFIEPRGYVYHREVTQVFVDRGGRGPVLDVGCGTGIVGEALRAAGPGPVDGIDISAEMLAQAAAKSSAGEPTYRHLVEADLTQGAPLESGQYGGVVSAGTFTHGHLGPEVLDELVRLLAPGGVLAVGVNAEHYTARGFAERLDALVERGLIDPPELVQVPIYTAGDDEHADDLANVVVTRRKG